MHAARPNHLKQFSAVLKFSVDTQYTYECIVCEQLLLIFAHFEFGVIMFQSRLVKDGASLQMQSCRHGFVRIAAAALSQTICIDEN
jgi:hypothetical protein